MFARQIVAILKSKNKNKNNIDHELQPVDELTTLEGQRRLVLQQLDIHKEQINHKEIDIQFRMNALKLLLNYKVDDINTIVDKGHELFILEEDLKMLKTEHDKLLQEHQYLVDKIQRLNDDN